MSSVFSARPEFLCALKRGSARRNLRKNQHRPATALESLEDRTLLANFTVDLLSDDVNGNVAAGDLSLREAISLSNTNGEADTIELPAGTIQLSIANSSGQENANATGDLDVTESFKLTIVGQGRGVTIIDGGDIDRIFHAHANVELELQDLTIQNGRAVDNGSTGLQPNVGPGHGGGILSDNASLKLTNVEVLNNAAEGSDFIRNARGGGVYVNTGTLELNSSAIDGNAATAANGNLGETGGFALGGGLFIWQSTATINATSISNNDAAGGDGSDGLNTFQSQPGGSALGGGVYAFGSTLSVDSATVSGNSATGAAGGDGRTGVTDTGSAAGRASGGGLYVSGGTAAISATTIDNNLVTGGEGGQGGDGFGGGDGGAGGPALGGGLWTDISVDLTNSTISGNATDGGVGGLGQAGGTNGANGAAVGGGFSDEGGSSLLNVTITENTSETGAGLAATGTSINNTIIAQNVDDKDVSGNLSGTGEANLIGNADGATSLPFGGSLNQIGSASGVGIIDAKLGPLQNNGGPAYTHLPDIDSPARDAGDDSIAATLTSDQRGAARFNGQIDIGSVEPQTTDGSAQNYVVTVATDEFDWTGNDATLALMGGAGDLSLREAIILSNVDPTTADTISFASGAGDAFENGGIISLTLGDIQIAGDVSISGDLDGDRAADITLDAGGLSGIFSIGGTATVGLTSLTLSNADAGTNDGGAIAAFAGTSVSVLNSTLNNNSATRGGAIFAEGTLAIAGTTIHDNTATTNGGAIFVGNTTTTPATLTIANVTLDNNTAGTSGGGIFAEFATATIGSTTVSENTATVGSGGGLALFSATATVTNSVLGLNSAATNAEATVSPDSTLNALNTFFGATTTTINGTDTNNINGGGDPELGALSMNGGPVETRTPAANSAILDAGDSSLLLTEDQLGLDVDNDDSISNAGITVDARGVAREIDVLGNGANPDMGAFELQQLSPPTDSQTFVVTTLADELDSVASDTTIDLMGGLADLSLREALFLANQNSASTDTITFDTTLFNGEPGDLILLPMGELEVTGPLVVDGNGTVEISGDNQSRIFNVSTTDAVTSLLGLTLSDGSAAGDGGAVYSLADLTVTDSIIQNSTANGIDAKGGGLFVDGNLELTNSYIASNQAIGSATSNGGGILVQNGDLTGANSTISANATLAPAADGGGVQIAGGVLTFANMTVADNMNGGLSAPGTDMVIDNSTFTGNSGGSGINASLSSTLTLTNSIVSGNVSATGSRTEISNVAPTFAGANMVGQTLIVDGVGVQTGVSADDIFDQTSELVVGGNPTGVFSGLFTGGNIVPTIGLETGGVADAAGNITLLPNDFADLDSDGDFTEALPIDANGNPRAGGGDVDLGAVQAGDVIGLVVTTTQDVVNNFDGVTSLREALAVANDPVAGDLNDGDADNDGEANDSIQFANSVAGGTFTLSLGELEITAPVTINSTSTPSIVITGDVNGDDTLFAGTRFTSVTASSAVLSDNIRIFNISNPAATTTLQRLSITGGRTELDSEPGGAIFSMADLTLDGTTLRGNSTVGADSTGGAVYVDGDIVVSNSIVRDNRTLGTNAAGGAIDATGTVSIETSTIRNNVTLGDDAVGGAIRGDEVFVDNSVIRRNTTSGLNSSGGGIYAVTQAAVSNSTINQNLTNGDNASGAGILSTDALVIFNSSIEANQTRGLASSGAGAFAGGTLTTINATVSENHTLGADASGGGIAASTLDLTNTTLANNTTAGSNSDGGGAFASIAANVSSSTITGNSTAGDQATGGGISSAAVALANSLVIGNATNFAGVSADEIDGAVTLTGGNLVGDTLTLGTSTITTGITAADIFAATTETLADTVADGVPEDPTGVFSGVLADNGGDVLTIALLANDANPVVDGGDSLTLPADVFDIDGDADTTEALPLDARQAVRNVSAANGAAQTDLGAFELQNGIQNFVVTTSADELDPADTDLATYDPDDLSLREAITLANLDAGFPDSISFNIPGTGPFVIDVTSALPTISTRVVIDATTQPGYTDAPLIGLDGTNAGTGTDGLQFAASDSGASGLAIYNFDSDGIELNGATQVSITNNYIGLDTTGTAAGNGIHGITSVGSSDILIDGNVIAGNGKSGVFVSEGSDSVTITDNFVGTNVAGDSAIANVANGIHILKSTNTTIDGNLVAGNGRNGITIGGAGATANNVTNNTVGTNLDGTEGLGNGFHGIWVRRGTQEISGNLSSGNSQSGIVVAGGLTENNVIENNKTGTNRAGTEAIPNRRSGIIVFAGTGNTVENNLSSGNLQRGILVSGGATQTSLLTNLVGTSADGLTGIPNRDEGIRIQAGSSETLVQGNVVSANLEGGILLIDDGTELNVIESNIIGATADESGVLANVGVAIEVRTANNIIGGSAGNGNVIAGGTRGILLTGTGASGNEFSHNFIGTDSTATATTFGNVIGVFLNNGPNDNTVGPANVIAGNQTGVRVNTSAGNGNAITANSIYNNSTIGIELADVGVTANDPGDADEGGNRIQNTPTLNAAIAIGADLEILYSVDSIAANATYPLTIEFFYADASGQGQTLVATDIYEAADAGTNKSVGPIVGAGGPLAAGAGLVATATDAAGNTSEFSAVVTQEVIPPTVDLQDPSDGTSIVATELNGRGYIDVTFTDATGIDLSTLDGDELVLSGDGTGTAVLTGAPTQVIDSTFRYSFTGEFVAGNVDVEFAAGSFADIAANVNEIDNESFVVLEGTPPVADLANPANAATILETIINAQSYIDVTFSDSTGLDVSSIDGDEIAISGPGLGSAVLDGSAELQSGTTYRYSFTGILIPGAVNVEFVANSFSDQIGNLNTAETESFTVVDAVDPVADLQSPENGDILSVTTINQIGYIDIAINDAGGIDPTTIDGDEFSITGSGIGSAVLDGTVSETSPGIFRYPFTGEFVPGDIDVTFNASSFADLAGNSNAEEIEGFSIVEATPPTALVADPADGVQIGDAVINGRGYIDVTFTDADSGLDTATIDGDELTLSGSGLGSAVLDGTAVPQAGGTYRFGFTGNFVPGAVSVNIVDGTFADLVGNTNTASSSTFTVLETSLPVADLASPTNLSAVSASDLSAMGYIDVTFTDAGGLDTATINGDEIEIAGSGVGTAALSGTAVLQSGTTYRYAFTGDFTPGLVTVTIVDASFADLAGNLNVEEFESFATQESTPPTADLASPVNGASIGAAELNGLGYIDVTFDDVVEVDSGIDASTITGDEIALSGIGAGSAVPDGTVTLVSGTTYRYGITGEFVPGEVTVTILADTFQDVVGNMNAADSESFTVLESVPPTADLVSPADGAAVADTVLNSQGYIDVEFSDVGSGIDPTTIDGDEIVLSGVGAGSVTLTGSAALQSGTTYRYPFTGSFAAGPVVVTFAADTFTDLNGNANEAEDEEFRSISSTLVVSTAADELDSIDTNLNTYDPNDLSLREALTLAGQISSAATIHFNIPGAGPHIINVTSALPALQDDLTIDGTSEPDYSGAPVVGLNGAGSGAGVNGLDIAAANVTIAGLAIYNFSGDGVAISGDSNNRITNNYIGLTPVGSAAGNGGNGVSIDVSNENRIDNNVISDNGAAGVLIDGNLNSILNTVDGNLIGTNPAGTAPIGNTTAGVEMRAFSNTIGGGTTAEANVIAGSPFGIHFTTDSLWNDLHLNYIGTDSTQTNSSLGNTVGVQIDNGSNNNRLLENVIANGQTGVRVTTNGGVGNAITRNSIYNNSSIGIDLGAVGPTANDNGDTDEGGNRTQNHPVISAATAVANEILVTYVVDSSASTTAYPIQVQFFLDDGSGSGRTFIGSANHNASSAGASLTDIVSSGGNAFAAGASIVATAVDVLGNTSEFSVPVAGGTSNGGGAASSERNLLDINNDGQATPLIDGVLLLRYLAGFSGDSLTQGIVEDDAGKQAISEFFATTDEAVFDIDGDNQTNPLSDGILVLRHLAGFSGDVLTADAVNSAGTRNESPAVQNRLDQLQQSSASILAELNSQGHSQTDEIDDLFAGGFDSLLD